MNFKGVTNFSIQTTREKWNKENLKYDKVSSYVLWQKIRQDENISMFQPTMHRISIIT